MASSPHLIIDSFGGVVRLAAAKHDAVDNESMRR
jgi:hypothetical protein